jgi:hypothetical protein
LCTKYKMLIVTEIYMTEKFRNILKGSMLIFRIRYIPEIPQIH